MSLCFQVVTIICLMTGVNSGVAYDKYYGRDTTPIKVNSFESISSTIRPESLESESGNSYAEQDYTDSSNTENTLQGQNEVDYEKDLQVYGRYEKDEQAGKIGQTVPTEFSTVEWRHLHDYPVRFVKITRTVAIPVPIAIPIQILPVAPLTIQPLAPLQRITMSYLPSYQQPFKSPIQYGRYQHPPLNDVLTDSPYHSKHYNNYTERSKLYVKVPSNLKSNRSHPLIKTKLIPSKIV